MRRFAPIAISIFLTLAAHAQKPRARDLGVPFDGTPGPNNAITDVKASKSATRPSSPAKANS